MTPQSCSGAGGPWLKKALYAFVAFGWGFVCLPQPALGLPRNIPFMGLNASPKPTMSGGSPNANHPAKFRQGFLPLLDSAEISLLITQIKGRECLRFLWLAWSTGQSSPAVLCAGWTPRCPSTHSFPAETLWECLEPTPESNRTKGASHACKAQHTRNFPPIPLLCSQRPHNVQQDRGAPPMHWGWNQDKEQKHIITAEHCDRQDLKEPPPATVKTREEWTLGKGKHLTGRSVLNRKSSQSRILEQTQEHSCDCIHPYLPRAVVESPSLGAFKRCAVVLLRDMV